MDFNLSNATPTQIDDLLCGLVAPRPIAWITSISANGELDVAPFSAYNYMGMDPPIVAVGIASKVGPGLVAKDTARNIRSHREFVVNVVNESVAEAMNLSAIDFPPEIDKLKIAHLETEPSLVVTVPRIASAPASLECREVMTLEIGKNTVILGRVVAIHVKDEFVDATGPFILAESLHAIGRMNGLGAYVKTADAFFTIPRLSYESWKRQGEQHSRGSAVIRTEPTSQVK